MIALISEKAISFDKQGILQKEIEKAIELLHAFREKYSFFSNPGSIETLNPEAIFKIEKKKMGDFFDWINYYLKPLGNLTLDQNIYRNIRSQFDDFKDLIYIVVDKNKSLAEKVDANWNVIAGLGGDKHLAKKIIFCFNYQTKNVVPIFDTNHLEYFVNTIVGKPNFSTKFLIMSVGEKYQYLTNVLLAEKESSKITNTWEITYFCYFLYRIFPPEDIKSRDKRKKQFEKTIFSHKLDFRYFMETLNQLRKSGKISAEDLRKYRKQWENRTQDRSIILARLKSL